jgi:hypothetical protein
MRATFFVLFFLYFLLPSFIQGVDQRCGSVILDSDLSICKNLVGLRAKDVSKIASLEGSILSSIDSSYVEHRNKSNPAHKDLIQVRSKCHKLMIDNLCHFKARLVDECIQKDLMIPETVKRYRSFSKSVFSDLSGEHYLRENLPGEVRLAFIFLIHEEEDGEERFSKQLQLLTTSRDITVVHIDAKASHAYRSRIEDILETHARGKVAMVPLDSSIGVKRFGISMIYATMVAMGRLIEVEGVSNVDFVINLSTTDFPTSSRRIIDRKLSPYVDRDIMQWYGGNHLKNRFERFWVECQEHESIPLAIKTDNRSLYPYPSIEKVYGGSQWTILSLPFVMYMMTSNEVEDALVYFHNSFCPDESFVQTVLFNSPFANNKIYDRQDGRRGGTWRYIYWRVGAERPTLESEDLPYILSSSAILARKFSNMTLLQEFLDLVEF